jgi:hypothetical protein
VVGEFEVPDTLREDLIDIVIIDLDRMALEHRPALVGNLIPSIPRGCFSDVTVAHNLTPRITKKVNNGHPNFILWDARGKPIRIGSFTFVPEKADAPESLAPRSEKRDATEKE